MMSSNEQDIRTRKANADKKTIVSHLNDMYRELNQTQGIYQFGYDEDSQIVWVDYGDDELTEIYVKGWSPSEVIRRIFEEVCSKLK